MTVGDVIVLVILAVALAGAVLLADAAGRAIADEAMNANQPYDRQDENAAPGPTPRDR